MAEPDLIELFVRPLEAAQLRYFISGSVAAMLYGEPRVTLDIDFVVFLRAEDVSRLPSVYPEPDFYLPPLEVIAVEARRELKGHFNVIHPKSGLKAGFYTANQDELHAWALRNVRRYAIDGRDIRLAPPEYVIVRKLEYFREGGSDKHVRDIRSMFAVSADHIDRVELEQWIRRRGLLAEWAKLAVL
jgi:hypothetical protein